MKVLWVCNVIPLPAIADALEERRPVIGGWLEGLATELAREASIDLHVAFPLPGTRRITTGRTGGVHYYGFPASKPGILSPSGNEVDISSRLRCALRSILDRSEPDLLHIFGTEYGHALVATQEFGKPSRTVVSIQGLVSVCARHYLGSLPRSARKRFAVSNLVRGSLETQVRRLEARGRLEDKTLASVRHVIGRTDWDRACAADLTPNAQYHYCNEVLRPSFYEQAWEPTGYEPYSIVTTQPANPMKGFYYVLEALRRIRKEFPEAHLYVVGRDPTDISSFGRRMRMSAYGGYLAELIDRYELHGAVSFMGELSENEMAARLASTHVYVSASTIENSSNALCEAQLLGVPTVSSFVGGLPSIVNHGQNGFEFQHDAPYMLAYYVRKLFRDPELARTLAACARECAGRRHDKAQIVETQIGIYSAMKADS